MAKRSTKPPIKKRSPAPMKKRPAPTQSKSKSKKPTPATAKKPEPKKKQSPDRAKSNAAQSYARHKESAATRQREQAKAGNDIGPIPDIVNLKRREACERDPEKYYKEYFPDVFRLPFSNDHRETIEIMDDVAKNGGFVPLVMARGSGKTALCRRFAIRSVSYGWRQFLLLIGADSGLANRSLSAIKKELRFNRRLLEDFPEICWPIRCLEGKSIKAGSQHVGGEPTLIIWTDGRLVLPTVKGSIASGAMIDVTGITGQVRGRNELKSDGREIRPDLFILDDPQTHESAYSVSQVETREQILMADIIEGAGPGEETCGIIPCTIIKRGDLADRLFDKKLHPEFRGRMFKALYALPTNEAIWNRYAEVLRNALEEEDDTGKVNVFYLKHRAELEEGAAVAWPDRKKKKFVSALQELMTLKILNPGVFASEYQAEPLDLSLEINDLTPAIIANKLNKLDQGIVPGDTAVLTAFIDVQKNILYYLVAAWADGFTGSIVDYGTWPETGSSWFRLAQLDKMMLAKATKLANLEEQLYEAMTQLTKKLLGREWKGDGGGISRIPLCLIDGNWPESKNVVYQFCRQSPFAANLLPSRGHYYGAKMMPISDKPRKEGTRRGFEWEIPPAAAGRPKSHLHWDTNFWKSHVHARLSAAMGSKGCLSLFGSDHRQHRMLSEHLTSEYRVRVEVPGRAVDEWQEKTGEDNHWFDCLVGSAVAASVLGISMDQVHESTKLKAQKRVSFSELQRQALERAGKK